MTSDSQDSRRKHRRSPSGDDSPEDSKRHKHRHRHHHRRHRHHHRHSSKKHNEETKTDEIEEELREAVPPPADYDMEEGEIVDDEAPIVADAATTDKKAESDVESGEFKVVDGDDNPYTMVDDAMAGLATNGLPAADHCRKNSKTSKSPGSDRSDDNKKYGRHHHHEESPILENAFDHDYDREFGKGQSKLHSRSKSPSKGSSKQKAKRGRESKHALDVMDVDEDEYEDRRKSSSHKVKDNRLKETSRSPSHGRYHVETSERSISASPRRRRGRERSQSILHDERSRARRHHERDERLYDNGMVHYELDDERDSRRSVDYGLGSRDIAKDKGREVSSSYHRSRGKDEDGDHMNREREEIYRDNKKVKEQEISRERIEKDQDRDREWEREQDRKRGRDHEREKESDKDRGKARESKSELDRDRERERERRREQERGRSRDRELERERRRDNSISYRDRSAEKDRVRDVEMDSGRDRNGDRDRYGDRIRDIGNERSRRHYRYDDRDDGYGYRDRRHGYDEEEYRRDRDRRRESEKASGSKDDSVKKSENGVNRDDGDQKDYEERVELELAEQEEDDINRIKEESRRRREAILQKYKAQQSQQQALPENAQASDKQPKEQHSQDLDAMNVVQEDIVVKANGQDASAVEPIFLLGKSPSRNEATDVEESTGAGGLGEGSPKSERSNDMFCDDIFGDSPAGVRKTGKGDGLPIERSGLHDNWDDPEGYYSFRFGEILDSRYEITAAHGKGVFSTVVRAKDLKAGPGDREEVAIKIIRNNETMLKAGTEELVILKKLVGADPDDRRHCVRYLSHFKYRNHLCIVFESLHMNLREVLKKFGRNIGLKLTAVRAYAKQLFIALKHLRNCGVLHCDIKPDNMLVNDAKNVLKLCDFGNAMFAGKNEITPYLVSRFYRAPEIILGLPYDHPMDIWSVGCCLYELYTGKVLFPGPTNNDMLRLQMELKGPFPKKMLRKGAFIEQHFDQDLNFLATEEDPVTKKTVRRLILNIKPKDIGTIIKGSPGEDPKMLANFKDLLDKIFVLDPDKRLTVSQALNHPFITGK